MKIYNLKKISFIISIFSFSNLFCQNYTLTSYFDLGVGHISWVTYNYEYLEFNQNAYLDSSIILESFQGELTVSIYNTFRMSDTTKYILLITKEGEKVRKTFFDTLSVENINLEYNDSVSTIWGISELGGSSHIYGWIFPDTLLESVVDSLDPNIMYPYSRLYSNYFAYSDTSWFRSVDTLKIHYRPKATNYNDSYYSFDYVIDKQYNTRSYSRYYSYFGEGFLENYTFKSGSWAGVNDSKENILPNSMTLNQNYPNPFNPTTKIKYSTKKRANIKLNIYNLIGNKVATLIDATKSIGEYEIEFDGSKLSSGVYFYRLVSDDNSITKKFVILK